VFAILPSLAYLLCLELLAESSFDCLRAVVVVVIEIRVDLQAAERVL
jgi:hypothetical protein